VLLANKVNDERRITEWISERASSEI
jgi:hypothetical protein